MAKGYGGGMPQGFNMNNLMKQAQKMQDQMTKTQAALEEREVEVTSGGGAVTVKMNGKKLVKSIKLKPEIVDPDDIEMLEDLILTSVNEAVRQVEELVNAEMAKVTGGVGIPGGMF